MMPYFSIDFRRSNLPSRPAATATAMLAGGGGCKAGEEACRQGQGKKRPQLRVLSTAAVRARGYGGPCSARLTYLGGGWASPAFARSVGSRHSVTCPRHRKLRHRLPDTYSWVSILGKGTTFVFEAVSLWTLQCTGDSRHYDTRVGGNLLELGATAYVLPPSSGAWLRKPMSLGGSFIRASTTWSQTSST